MKRNKKRDNLEVNLDFLCEYTEENHLNANDNLLEKLARSEEHTSELQSQR